MVKKKARISNGKKENKENVKQNKSVKSKPIGLIIVSILFYISAALMILSGIVLVLAQYDIINLTEMLKVSEQNASLLVSGIISIMLGIAYFIIAYNLLKLKYWARMIALFLSIFTVVNYAFSLRGDSLIIISSLARILINLWIIWFLVKNKGMFK